jgi:hypothetical protein
MTVRDPEDAVMHQSSKNWFERNPKKTICFLLIIFSLICLLGTEKFLQKETNISSYGAQRFINLREHHPLFSGYIYPTDEDLRNAESLERKQYLLRVDNNGYILPSQIHSKADLTIVFLGGSTTECLYMNEEERFPYLVGRLLEKDLKLKINSYNSGKAGNNSLHSIDILLNKVMYINPDIVVMMHNINDLIILLFEKSYWNNNLYKSPVIGIKPSIGKNLAQSLVIMRDYFIPNISNALAGLSERSFAKTQPTEFPAIKGAKIDLNIPQLLQEFRANVQIFIDICRHRQIVPILMTMASRFKDDPDPFIASSLRRIEVEHGINYQDFKKIFDLFNEEIRMVGTANNVLVIDLAEKIPQERTYLYDTVHLTSNGSHLTSQVIHQYLSHKIQNIMAQKNQKNFD